MSDKCRLVSAKLGVIAIIAVSTLLFAEIGLRILGFSYVPLRLKMMGKEKEICGLKGDYRQEHPVQSYFVFDPHLIWRPKNNFKIFNSQGFRGPEINIKKRPGDLYIFAFGDSNTLGPDSAPGWVDYLSGLIKNVRPEAKLVNAGVWGYTSFQCYRRFKEVLKYSPDIILLSCCSNDALRVIIPDREYVSTKKYFSSKAASLRLSQFFFMAQDRLLLSRKTDNKCLLTPRVGPDEFADYLNKIISLSRKNNIRVVLLTRPFIDFWAPDNESLWMNFTPEYNDLVIKASKDKNLQVVDLYSLFKGKKELFANDSHFNDEGHKVAAEIIYKQIKDLL